MCDGTRRLFQTGRPRDRMTKRTEPKPPKGIDSDNRETDCMETLLREAKEKYNEIPSSLKEQIVLEHSALIRYIVNRIAVRLPSHIDLDDLHNTGVIGLMDAIEKYDPDKNCKFKTYAEFRIKGAILGQTSCRSGW